MWSLVTGSFSRERSLGGRGRNQEPWHRLSWAGPLTRLNLNRSVTLYSWAEPQSGVQSPGKAGSLSPRTHRTSIKGAQGPQSPPAAPSCHHPLYSQLQTTRPALESRWDRPIREEIGELPEALGARPGGHISNPGAKECCISWARHTSFWELGVAATALATADRPRHPIPCLVWARAWWAPLWRLQPGVGGAQGAQVG